MTNDYRKLPADLPVPQDDGAARHLVGAVMPDLVLPATNGVDVHLAQLPGPRTVIYLYPMTGEPGTQLPDGWDGIPGARGCTPESCGFRDHHAALATAGAAVYGLSSQSTAAQREAAERLELPFTLLSDESLTVAAALRLPTFSAGGRVRYQRLTLVVREARVEHAFYPVFPPDRHAEQVLAWLHGHRS